MEIKEQHCVNVVEQDFLHDLIHFKWDCIYNKYCLIIGDVKLA